jgi:hypothetical protein
LLEAEDSSESPSPVELQKPNARSSNARNQLTSYLKPASGELTAAQLNENSRSLTKDKSKAKDDLISFFPDQIAKVLHGMLYQAIVQLIMWIPTYRKAVKTLTDRELAAKFILTHCEWQDQSSDGLNFCTEVITFCISEHMHQKVDGSSFRVCFNFSLPLHNCQ